MIEQLSHQIRRNSSPFSLYTTYLISIISVVNGQINTEESSCPCINAVNVFSTLVNCGGWEMREKNSSPSGVLVDYLGSVQCVPINFGTHCKQHDLAHDPKCSSAGEVIYDNGVARQPIPAPEYCFDQWCFVDKATCKNSTELFYRTSTSTLSEANLFYSYSTCNSSAQAWLSFQTMKSLEGKSVRVTIPGYVPPAHYKNDENGERAHPSLTSIYNNDSIPWKGFVVDYLNALDKISNNAGFKFTHNSVGSKTVIKDSNYTASVYDVQVGLADMAAGYFWITSERLKMTTFTTAVATDKIFLWVLEKNESWEDEFVYFTRNMLVPFHPSLWMLLLWSIFLISIAAVWVSKNDGTYGIWHKRFESNEWKNASWFDRFLVTMKTLLDSFLAHATLFFTSSTDINLHGSLPQRIFMPGFAFMVLLIITSYTANLAAILTVPKPYKIISSIEEVDILCGHPALKEDYKKLFPGVKFHFTETGGDNMGMIKAFREQKCDAMAASAVEIYNCVECMEALCEEPMIIVTDIVFVDIPVAFPISQKFAAGISYWMLEGENMHINFMQYEESERPDQQCTLNPPVPVRLLKPLSPKQMALPFLVLVFSLFVAITIHLCNDLKKSSLLSSCMSIRHTPNQQNTRDEHQEENNDTTIKEHPIGVNGKHLESIETIKSLQHYQNDLLQTILSEK